MQLAILEFFQSLSSPLLDSIVSAVTMFGEQNVFIVIITYMIWNVSKRKGFLLFSTLAFSLVVMGFTKAIVKAPRPYQVIAEIEGKRVHTATGYSFPSGHTTGAAAFYSSLSMIFRKRWLSIICSLIIVIVALSRIYLGVHWPLDVFGGLALGITGTAILFPALSGLYDDRERLGNFTMIGGIISLFGALTLLVTMEIGIGDDTAYLDIMKLLSLLGTGYIGFSFALADLDYSVEHTIGIKLTRYVIGMAGIIAIQSMKLILPELLIVTFFRYSLIGLWITFLYPYIGVRLKLFSLEHR
ncbi:MAG: phosphatase PAP2 family protein [Sphaerochaetaceae bacterium]|nr:phosphatase PAP2 family protein [Sphaerochaetaceae bacterium]MDC7247385.1 phosphatase PAP2 family protein [Sphaerochaetaceae bacterium]